MALAALLGLALAGPARAASAPPVWEDLADIDTIQIRTTDVEGDPVDRTIWLLVLDGQGYIRAGGSSRWDANIDAHPDVSAQIDGIWYDLRAKRIPEGPLYDQVMQGMRDKYGFPDMVLTPLRALGGAPRILRLDSRPGIPMGRP
jgi:hypothetical protein